MNGDNNICRKDTPYPSVSQESVPSILNNLTHALYGTITKTVVNRQVIWTTCDPNLSMTLFNIARNPGEGLLCYFIRVLQLQNFVGPQGPAGTIDISSTATGAPGTAATVINVGTPSAAVLDFTIPSGLTGTSATVQVGTTTTLSAGASATVTNVGPTINNAVFNFGIPTGPQGPSATVNVGTTTTLAPGTNAAVTNSGTTGAAVFNFSIPRGAIGATGSTSTIAVGVVTSGPTPAVTNTGTSTAAIFDFVLEAGPKGDPGTISVVTGSTVSSYTGNGSTTTFGPITNWSTTSAGNYLVSVSGLDQRPTTDWSISGTGQLVFVTAPPNNAPILVRAFSGGSGNATRLQDRPVAATTPTNGYVLAWNNGLNQWEPTQQTVNYGTY